MPSGQSWWTFLRNHAPESAAMDLFVVPTLAFNLLYGFIIVRLDRRELVHIAVTNSPPAAARGGAFRLHGRQAHPGSDRGRRGRYEAYLDLVTWVKTNAGQGGLYRKQSEFIGVFRVGGGPNRNNVQMGKFGRNRSNVWTYAGANTFRSGRMEDLAAHPTVKPLRLVADALKDVTAPGEAVLDSFAGSGTTILAAERVGRQARALEIDPKYADIAIRRYRGSVLTQSKFLRRLLEDSDSIL
jgi:DNA methylase